MPRVSQYMMWYRAISMQYLCDDIYAISSAPNPRGLKLHSQTDLDMIIIFSLRCKGGYPSRFCVVAKDTSSNALDLCEFDFSTHTRVKKRQRQKVSLGALGTGDADDGAAHFCFSSFVGITLSHRNFQGRFTSFFISPIPTSTQTKPNVQTRERDELGSQKYQENLDHGLWKI